MPTSAREVLQYMQPAILDPKPKTLLVQFSGVPTRSVLVYDFLNPKP